MKRFRRRAGIETISPGRSLRRALQALRATREIYWLQVSRIYETDPVGPPPQDPYLNAVAKLETELSPRALLERLLDADEFLSDYGVRSVSRRHASQQDLGELPGIGRASIEYLPGESNSGMFGGNSNWRGPVWFPVNFLLIESLQKFHHYFGDTFQIECPTGSGKMMNLWQVAQELSLRLSRIFLRDSTGKRAVYGINGKFQADPHWKDYLLFYEYFHGDNGAGLGASHQTGWTALVANLLQERGGPPRL